MKKLLSFLLIPILMLSCADNSNELQQPENQVIPTCVSQNKRSMENAIAIAEAYGDASFVGNSKSSNAVDVICDLNKMNEVDTLIYVVNLSNDETVLVSAALSGEPVIAFIDEGSFDVDSYENNPNFSYYMDNAKNYVREQMSTNGEVIVNPTLPYTVTSWYGEKLATKWGTRFPEGLFCPNGVSGCVQTAMALCLSYVEQPKSFQLTYENADKQIENLDWDSIKKHTQSFDTQNEYDLHASSCNSSSSSELALARLCRQLGKLNDAIYDKENATGVIGPEWVTVPTLKTIAPDINVKGPFFFEEDYKDLHLNHIYKNNCLAIVYGYNTYYSHAWVCDGSKVVEKKQDLTLIGGKKQTVTLSTTIYYHFNWGWNGQYNGYFLAGVFDTDKKEPESTILAAPSRVEFNDDLSYFIISK